MPGQGASGLSSVTELHARPRPGHRPEPASGHMRDRVHSAPGNELSNALVMHAGVALRPAPHLPHGRLRRSRELHESRCQTWVRWRYTVGSTTFAPQVCAVSISAHRIERDDGGRGTGVGSVAASALAKTCLSSPPFGPVRRGPVRRKKASHGHVRTVPDTRPPSWKAGWVHPHEFESRILRQLTRGNAPSAMFAGGSAFGRWPVLGPVAKPGLAAQAGRGRTVANACERLGSSRLLWEAGAQRESGLGLRPHSSIRVSTAT